MPTDKIEPVQTPPHAATILDHLLSWVDRPSTPPSTPTVLAAAFACPGRLMAEAAAKTATYCEYHERGARFLVTVRV
jgi:hypothetical protein